MRVIEERLIINRDRGRVNHTGDRQTEGELIINKERRV
jgi:hypothetical protein